MSRILTIALATSLTSTSVTAVTPPVASGPQRGTVEAVQCLVHQIPAGCTEKFQKGRAQTGATRWLSQSHDRDFELGPVVLIKYSGRALGENTDVFAVKFAHGEQYTFYISPVDANGKIPSWTFGMSPPGDPQVRLPP